MFVKLLGLILLAFVVVAVVAHGSPGRGHEQIYRVRPGDTLWAIAASHYAGDPREAIWKIEQRNNRESAAIRVGERLVLP